MNIIQTKGSVLTTSEITPHLSHRQFIKLIIEEEELPRDEALAEYDYVLINENLDKCVEEVLTILYAERKKKSRQNFLFEMVGKLLE